MNTMRVTKALGSLALAAIIAATGLGAAHPTNAGAASCPLEYLAADPMYHGSTLVGTVYLIKNDCDGKIFGRTSTPLWNANVLTALSDGGSVVATSGSGATWLTTGGHVDTPEVTPISGHMYSASGEVFTVVVISWIPITTGDWKGQTAAWTAP